MKFGRDSRYEQSIIDDGRWSTFGFSIDDLAATANVLTGDFQDSVYSTVLTCPVGVFVASLVRTLQRYVHSPRYAITSQLGGDLGCGVVGVFHDFLEPALLSGWPVFQLIHFFTSIVRLNDGFEEPQLLTIYLSEPDRCRIGS